MNNTDFKLRCAICNNQIILGSAKVLVIKNKIICPSCDEELSSHYLKSILDVSDVLNSFNSLYLDYEFEDYKDEEQAFPQKNISYLNAAQSNKINTYEIYKEVVSNVIRSG